MQKTICYYITGFGFGHLTRSLAIIEALLVKYTDVHVIIKADDRLLKKARQYLQTYAGRFSLHSFASHFSIVVDPATRRVDLEATARDALRWIGNLPASAQAETMFLAEQRVSLVLSDIVPEAFRAAKEQHIPAVGISNFTWYEICADVLGANPLLAPLLEMYQEAGELLVYPFSTGDYLPLMSKREVGPVTRPFDREKIGQIRSRYKEGKRPLAFLSVGGSTRVEDFPLRADMDYLVTMGIEVEDVVNVHRLSPDIPDSHNYLAACDVVITKCGWSTVAEAALAGVPLWLMLSKNGWLEERCIYQEVFSLGIGLEKTFTGMEAMKTREVAAELAALQSACAKIPARYRDGMGKITEIIKLYIG